jgi:hypothetical protein
MEEEGPKLKVIQGGKSPHQESHIKAGHVHEWQATSWSYWEDAAPSDPVEDIKNFWKSYAEKSRHGTLRLVRGGMEINDGPDASSPSGPGDPPVAS